MRRVVMVLVLVAAAGALAAYGQGGYGDYSTSPTPAAPAQGAAVRTQVRTALTHAGFAAGGDTLAYVTQHLGHALNCIEGEGGKNFNRAWGHVCQGQGRGILTDLRAAPGGSDLLLVAQAADDLAVAGVKSRNLNEARLAAKGVAALLQVIADTVK